MTKTTTPRGAGFWLTFVVGWAVIGYGLSLALSIRGGLGTTAEIAAWVAGGHLVHDAVVAPAAALAGTALVAATVPWVRGLVRAGLLATACVLAVAYPALRGFGAKPRNPSVLPLDYDRAVVTVLGVVWGAVALLVLVAFVRRGSTRRPPLASRRGTES